jgi:signal transduction histidine kinase
MRSKVARRKSAAATLSDTDVAKVGTRGISTRNARYAVTLTATAGLALTLLITSVGSIEPVAYQNRALHVAKETAAGLVLLLVASLLAGRFRRSGALLDLLALAGVLLLAIKNLAFSVLTAILTETSGGLTTWRTTGAGMVGAAILAAAAMAPTRILRDRQRAIVLTAAGCLVAILLLSAVAGISQFPGAFDEPPETKAELGYLSQHPALVVADAGATVLFLIAGLAFGRRAEREGDEFQMWLGIGATIAGIGYLNYTLFPSSFTDFLYAGDLFRVAAVVAWGIGTIREIGRYQDAYAEAAVLRERRRVARDLHDGVAQELAFISSQMHWLEKERPEAPATGQIMESVQRALDESRGAISALSRPIDEPFSVVLTQTAEELARRMGARLELDLDENVDVPPEWEDALPRIVREAVSNAVRHGNARNVTVHLRDADGIWVRVTDDGEGFDVTEPQPEDSYGLISMKERAEALGAQFSISSSPGHGTSVEIMLPHGEPGTARVQGG